MKAFPGNRFEGMELRDYFAARAMQGLIGKKPLIIGFNETTIAIDAYKVADAMMKARKESPQND